MICIELSHIGVDPSVQLIVNKDSAPVVWSRDEWAGERGVGGAPVAASMAVGTEEQAVLRQVWGR